jgi:hypothetical protein
METLLKVLLGIPEPLRIYHLVPIGYAKSQVAAPPRRELSEIVHFEKYDMNKFRDDQGMTNFIMSRTCKGPTEEGESAKSRNARACCSKWRSR